MRVLVTNDDGIGAPGLHALTVAMVESGFDVVAVAPLTDMSGSGASIGRLHFDEHVDIEVRELPGLPGVTAIGVDGPPALAVIVAHLGGLGEVPDLVVSGINPGTNTGRALIHSGTVGAALTARNFGSPAVAVSMSGSTAPVMHWETAAALTQEAVQWLIDNDELVVLNLNVPNCPPEELRGVRWGRLAPFGTVQTAIAEAPGQPGAGRLQMELRETTVGLPPDCDTALVAQQYASVTAIDGIIASRHQPVADHLDQHILRRSA